MRAEIDRVSQDVSTYPYHIGKNAISSSKQKISQGLQREIYSVMFNNSYYAGSNKSAR